MGMYTNLYIDVIRRCPVVRPLTSVWPLDVSESRAWEPFLQAALGLAWLSL